MDDLIQKYYPIINSVNKNLWDGYAKTLETCVVYLKNNNEIDINLKIAATFVVKQLFLDDDKFGEKKIETIIDNFINHHKENYQNYMNGFVMISDQFDADLGFYYSYIKKIKD